MGVMKKLLAVQSELKAPKGQYNSFGKYKYRSCEDILEAVKPLLAKHSAVITISDEVKLIGDRYYIEATATFIDAETDASFSVTASAREEKEKKGMDGSQVTGASSSYARKYALNGLLAIDDTKDSDSTNTHDKSNTNVSNDDSFETYICADCGKEVKAFGNYSAKQVAGINQKKYGRILCADCSTKLKAN